MQIIRSLTAAASAIASLGTALSLVRHPHWLFRMCDFPRAQIGTGALGATGLYAARFYRGKRWEQALLATGAVTVAWQAHKIAPYTPLKRRRVHDAPPAVRKTAPALTVLVSNVLMENTDHATLLDLIAREAPDVVLAVEVDAAWAEALAVLETDYPHHIRHVLPNYYGMALYSRYPLVAPEVLFRVQPDIPSIRTGIRLPSGLVVTFHGVHPRPPEPFRNQISAPRDAELVRVGREVAAGDGGPTIVAGDLNDVAWSHSSQLFLRLSGLLDPRVGRGLYNTFDATSRILRYPLDHVFHSPDFMLGELQRLPAIGSDHFPIKLTLYHVPQAETIQPQLQPRAGDEAEADVLLATQAEAQATGRDRPFS